MKAAQKDKSHVLVFDGNHTLHRCLHVPGLKDLIDHWGRHTGGPFGTIQVVESTIRKFQDAAPDTSFTAVLVWDGAKSKRRIEVFPGYKKRLPNKPVKHRVARGEFARQQCWIGAFLTSMGVRVVRDPALVGDDTTSSSWSPPRSRSTDRSRNST